MQEPKFIVVEWVTDENGETIEYLDHYSFSKLTEALEKLKNDKSCTHIDYVDESGERFYSAIGSTAKE